MGQNCGIYLSSLAAKEKKLLASARSNPGYANGHLYYVDQRNSLIAVPLNLRGGEVEGQPTVVTDRVTYRPAVCYGVFGVGGNNTVISSTGSGAMLSLLTWYDRNGRDLGGIGEPGVIADPTISPDGEHTTVDIADLKSANVDIWVQDLPRHVSSRFTFDPAEEVTGVWSRDGTLIAYRSMAKGGPELMVKRTNGLEPPRGVHSAGDDDILPNSWVPGDKQILCSYHPAAGGSDLVMMDVATGKMTPLVATNDFVRASRSAPSIRASTARANAWSRGG